MPVELDDSTWPVVMLRINGVLSPEEEDEFIRTSVGFPARREHYTAIIDLLEAPTPSTRFVRAQAHAQRTHLEELRSYCVGVAFVIRSAMLRGALRAILHIQGLPSPHIVVETVDEARAWTTKMLGQKR